MDWTRIAALRSVLLVLIGFALLAVGAFTLNHIAGYGVTGIEVLALAYLTDPAGAQQQVRR